MASDTTAIVEQPGKGDKEWMPKPQVSGCPPGLEYLTVIDQILVKQKVELFEAFTGIDCKNKYVMTNSMGQQVYFAYEESGLCMRLCCSQYRSFTMHILDNQGQEVIRVTRPFQICAGCCWCISGKNCCAYRITIEAPPGNPIGYVHQGCSVWKPKYYVQDEDMNDVLSIGGPCCPCQCCCGCTGDVHFRFYGKDGIEIGSVSKVWNGLVKEMFTKADSFTVTFPKDLDVKQKATLLGAMFLIEFMYFESEDQT
ncbi:phospholipid scramblase 1-like [Apostichopus japonicus]|uniref:phospholipid scramblase 1-like n=1 Tax=Stichopus japonicus TaxID=307972 RepID=UPI003AB62F6D